MKYTGRIVLLLLTTTTTISGIFVNYLEYSVIYWIEILTHLPFFILAWFLGRRHDQATYYAHYDLLTHVYNRYYVTKLIQKMLRRTRKSSSTMTIFIIDIDNFKEINDTYGHQKGDLILELVASTIKLDIRKSDIIGRLGGDEFLVSIPNIDTKTTERIKRRWRGKLSYINNQIGIPISISIGNASFPFDGQNFDDLYHVADLKMYKDKMLQKSQLSNQ